MKKAERDLVIGLLRGRLKSIIDRVEGLGRESYPVELNFVISELYSVSHHVSEISNSIPDVLDYVEYEIDALEENQ